MRWLLLLLCVGLMAGADLQPVLNRLASEAAEDRRAAVAELAASGDMRLVQFFEDYQQGSVAAWQGRVVVLTEAGTPKDALERTVLASAVPGKDLVELTISRKERILARDAITLLRLADPDRDARLAAVNKAADAGGEANAKALGVVLTIEKDERIRRSALEGVALFALTNEASTAARIAAAQTLSNLHAARALVALREQQAKHPDPAVQKACALAVSSIESWQTGVRSAQNLFAGLSAGSILILMALGLSITFGLMGVINMAHGELMMVGGYACFLVQQAFMFLPPAYMDWYFPLAIPAAMIAAGVVGWLLELTLIRHLYGRPLETLLATWGVSYVLIQAAREIFGDNRAVTAPTWLQGGVEVVTDLVLPYNRLFILGFCALCVVGMGVLLARTRLGLLLRATTQNRVMSSTLGVNTRRIDGWTFAIGSALAGGAGAVLTLIGGITPDVGQGYIVDSFLVVATGGVGKLAGAVWAGLGLGVLNKLLEPAFQAVWAKVMILGVVIVFLQWRPSGLFPAKGRFADG